LSFARITLRRRTATEPSVAIENPAAEAGHAGRDAVFSAGSLAVRAAASNELFHFA
jgi:hypothetical protein